MLAQRQLQQALHELAEDKERMAHLVQRQHDLIACLGKLNSMEKAIGGEGSAAAEALSNLKRQICSSSDAMMGNPGFDEDMHMMELLGAGSVSRGGSVGASPMCSQDGAVCAVLSCSCISYIPQQQH